MAAVGAGTPAPGAPAAGRRRSRSAPSPPTTAASSRASHAAISLHRQHARPPRPRCTPRLRVGTVHGGEDLTALAVDERHQRGRLRRQPRPARARGAAGVGTPTRRTPPSACARARAVATPMRRPVKAPGPRPTTTVSHVGPRGARRRRGRRARRGAGAACAPGPPARPPRRPRCRRRRTERHRARGRRRLEGEDHERRLGLERPGAPRPMPGRDRTLGGVALEGRGRRRRATRLRGVRCYSSSRTSAGGSSSCRPPATRRT